jgi:catechol 2,3-dioxygenase-like lactoylglutathione lyase family enzyme
MARLSSYRVGAVIAVSDMARAREFYEGKLGLSAGEEQPEGGRRYICAGGTSLDVYPSPAHAGKATATLAVWDVDDVEQVVDELTANGVTFERYDEPGIRTDEKGITVEGDVRAAWFKDPDGNTFAVVGR